MELKKDKINYIIISPVKDEEDYIEDAIKSVIGQTIRPYRWIIVDDGSVDSSVDIIRRYVEKYDWINILYTERGPSRDLGSAEILAFNMGYNMVKGLDFDFIVKLDCDVRFDESYFESIFKEVVGDERWGIVSGTYYEEKGENWYPIIMPDYHAAGACKIVKKKCFEEIGGFLPQKGWDTLDQIRARIKGWKTGHFNNIKFYHLKTEGSAMGSIKTNIFQGEIYYLTGGNPIFFCLKCMHRIVFGNPFIVGGLMMIFGYVKLLVRKRKRLVSIEEAEFYNKQLNERIYISFKYFHKLPLNKTS